MASRSPGPTCRSVVRGISSGPSSMAGIPILRFADLSRDEELLREAQIRARRRVGQDPELASSGEQEGHGLCSGPGTRRSSGCSGWVDPGLTLRTGLTLWPQATKVRHSD